MSDDPTAFEASAVQWTPGRRERIIEAMSQAYEEVAHDEGSYHDAMTAAYEACIKGLKLP